MFGIQFVVQAHPQALKPGNGTEISRQSLIQPHVLPTPHSTSLINPQIVPNLTPNCSWTIGTTMAHIQFFWCPAISPPNLENKSKTTRHINSAGLTICFFTLLWTSLPEIRKLTPISVVVWSFTLLWTSLLETLNLTSSFFSFLALFDYG